MTAAPFNFLFEYYTSVRPNERVLTLCGATERGRPYTRERDEDLTVVVNAYARPEYLPLIWEAIQYQSRRPASTWIVQNSPGRGSVVPRGFFQQVGAAGDTLVVDSDLNHGCWFRFFLAALSCRTRYLAVVDDDTLPGRL